MLLHDLKVKKAVFYVPIVVKKHSFLAGSAVKGRALLLCDLFDWPATLGTGFPGFAVNEQFLSEIAWLAIFAREITQCGAALFDGISQNLFNSLYQPLGTCSG